MRDAAFACIRRVGVETGGSNVQFALNPANGEMVDHRDEPAGVAVVGAGLEGHRVPDRQDRRQAGRRLHARRDPQRHHAGHAGQLRADHRLRRHQGAALGVREVPRHARRARHLDAVGGRGHGHRPHLPRVAAEGAALARARPPRPGLRPGRDGPRRPRRRGAARARPPSARPTAPSSSRPPCGAASPSRCSPSAPRSTRGSSTRSSPSSRSGPCSPRSASTAMDRRAWRRAKRLGFADAQLAWLWSVPEAEVRAARLAAGVRATFKTVDTCAAEFEADDAVPLLHLRGRGRGRPLGSPQGAHPRLRARTASGRASSSTTAACTPASPWPTPASRR